MNEPIFTLSTGHISLDTNGIFEQFCHNVGDVPEVGDSLSFRIASHHYGWILFILEEPDQEREQKDFEKLGTPELAEIFRLARKNGAYLINLDRDAAQHDDLTVYDW